jgi:hypothetical protein
MPYTAPSHGTGQHPAAQSAKRPHPLAHRSGKPCVFGPGQPLHPALRWCRSRQRQVLLVPALPMPGRLLPEVEVPRSLDDEMAPAELRAADDTPVEAHDAVVTRCECDRHGVHAVTVPLGGHLARSEEHQVAVQSPGCVGRRPLRPGCRCGAGWSGPVRRMRRLASAGRGRCRARRCSPAPRPRRPDLARRGALAGHAAGAPPPGRSGPAQSRRRRGRSARAPRRDCPPRDRRRRSPGRSSGPLTGSCAGTAR